MFSAAAATSTISTGAARPTCAASAGLHVQRNSDDLIDIRGRYVNRYVTGSIDRITAVTASAALTASAATAT